MALRYQNNSHTTNRVPGYYSNNKLYPGAYTRNDYPTRTSRRVHDGLSIDKNFGLDTVSDDVNSSPYSSPYYINGRYNSDNLTTQRCNSASVQGIERLLSIHDEENDFTDSDIQGYIELWQGKQIKFDIPYNGKIVGNTIEIRNPDRCTGILSIYFSATDGGAPLYETAVDLRKVSADYFQHLKVYSSKVFSANANSINTLFVRMEIWDEISEERSENPFNTGKKIEIAATGLGNHSACVYKLGDKNVPAKETYDYNRLPYRPLIGLIYNNWESVPTNRTENEKNGALISLDGYRYDIYCAKSTSSAEILIYDKQMNQFVQGTDLTVDGRVERLNIVQAADYVYYVDGYSPLQKFRIGDWTSIQFDSTVADDIQVSVNLATWQASGVATASGTYNIYYRSGSWQLSGATVNLSTLGITISGNYTEGGHITIIYSMASGETEASVTASYSDNRPVIGASVITLHNNRIYLSGFKTDPNLINYSEIASIGPDFDSYPYRFYSPSTSPLSTSLNKIIDIVEYQSDTLCIAGEHFVSLYTSNSSVENETPQQISTFTDGIGIEAQGDIVNYKGILYSFDQNEGIRRFTGALWNKIPASVDSHIERVDMDKPRKLWGYDNKLYFNYVDKIDGKRKCLVWDMEMNYQQYPWFMDVDMPFCDVRFDKDYDLTGIHPDYPCVMQLYKQDKWSRFDSPITFERHTKFISLPGNSSDMILKRVHNKVLANADRWWWFSLSYDKHSLAQYRGKDTWYRLPCWDTINIDEPVETPFPFEDEYEEDSVALLTLSNLRIHAISVQEKVKCKTFRDQANLISTLFEAQPRQYN
mgnify:CR=1 FL=1